MTALDYLSRPKTKTPKASFGSWFLRGFKLRRVRAQIETVRIAWSTVSNSDPRIEILRIKSGTDSRTRALHIPRRQKQKCPRSFDRRHFCLMASPRGFEPRLLS